MVSSNGLFRIFWPSDAPRVQTQGVLIGWRNSDFDVLVIAVLQQVEVSRGLNSLRYNSNLCYLGSER
jgi:phosphatidylinositol glycan class Q protein